MRVLGMRCSVKDGRPAVAGVVVELTASGPTMVDEFNFLGSRTEDLSLQLTNLQRALDSWFPTSGASKVVLVALDYFKGARAAFTLQRRFGADGVVMATLRARTDQVAYLTGKQIAEALGCNKEQSKARGEALIDAARADVGAAALAALS